MHPSTEKTWLQSVGRRPERALILLGAAFQGGNQVPEALVPQIASGRVDWPLFLKSALWHGLSPDVIGRIVRLAGEEVPPHIQSAVEALGYEVAARNTLLARELVEIAVAFGEAGVRPLFFKGLVLGELLYGGIASRKAGDIDVLVRPEEALLAEEILLSLGYRHGARYPPLTRALAAADGYHVGYVRTGPTGRQTLVELHWKLVARKLNFPMSCPALDTGRVFERAAVVSLEGKPLLTLSDLDALVHLCAHAAKHNWGFANALADISRAFRRAGVDVVMRYREQHRGRAEALLLDFALYLCSRWAGLDLPPDFQRELDDDPRFARLKHVVSPERLFRLAGEEVGVLGLSTRLADAGGLLPSRLDKWLNFGRFAFITTQAEKDVIALPAGLRGLYPVLRIVRLSLKLVRRTATKLLKG